MIKGQRDSKSEPHYSRSADRLETLDALEKYHAEHILDNSKKIYAFIKVDANYQ